LLRDFAVKQLHRVLVSVKVFSFKNDVGGSSTVAVEACASNATDVFDAMVVGVNVVDVDFGWSVNGNNPCPFLVIFRVGYGLVLSERLGNKTYREEQDAIE